MFVRTDLVSGMGSTVTAIHLWCRQFVGTPVLGALGLSGQLGQDPVKYDSVSLLDSFKPHRNGMLIAAFLKLHFKLKESRCIHLYRMKKEVDHPRIALCLLEPLSADGALASTMIMTSCESSSNAT
jgi:hypothetical protein